MTLETSVLYGGNFHQFCQSYQVVKMILLSPYIIGASVSEPHTSELNGGTSLIYVSYVIRRTSSARVRTPRTDTKRVI